MIFHSTSKRPVLLVGNGARLADCQDLLLEFLARTDIPIVTTMPAVDLIQDEEKLGFIGVYGNRWVNMMLSHADLLISVGARLNNRQTGHILEYFAPNAKLIRVDIDPYEISRSVKVDEEKYNIDARAFLEELLKEEIPKYSAWRARCFQAKELLARTDVEIGNEAIEKISSLLKKDAIVAIDVGQNQVWAAQSLTLKGQAGRMLFSGGYGSMGCGLPYALGAAAATDDIIYCITGDGGLQMNMQELQVVVRDQLPIKILVLNNSALGKITEVQAVSYGARFAYTTPTTGYTVPDFAKIAAAYGIKAATVATIDELDQYQEWFLDREPCLLNIALPVDTMLIPKLAFKGREMSPLLDRDLKAEVDTLLSDC